MCSHRRCWCHPMNWRSGGTGHPLMMVSWLPAFTKSRIISEFPLPVSAAVSYTSGCSIKKNGKLNEAHLRKSRERELAEYSAPPLYSKPYVEVIAKSLDRCKMSMRRATGLLDMNYEDLRDLFAAHGVKADI